MILTHLFLNKLYPWKPKLKFHLVQQQPNNTDCGLYAIAFATSICIEDKPEYIQYDESQLRTWVVQLLKEKRIKRFPEKVALRH